VDPYSTILRVYEAPSQLLPFEMLAELWVFADAHGIPLLQSVVAELITETIENSKAFPARHVLTYITHNTRGSAQLRCLLNDVFRALTSHAVDWKNFMLDDDNEYQSSTTLRESMDYDKLRLSGPHCRYHVHTAGVSCNRS
jgi:hypothetical protein